MDEALTTKIDAWMAQDPDPDTRAALADLLARAEAGDAAAQAELADAFAGPLAFGTAGLRAVMGPGPGRMNRVVVTQAAAGLARWLLDEAGCSKGEPVIIGYDARYKSADFAKDTAQVLAAAGFKPLLASAPVPTPSVAFGIRSLHCAAGVMCTASHNPAHDNGYKVYNRDASQIIPPMDTQIAAHIAEVAAHPLSEIARSDDYELIDGALLDPYIARAASLVGDTPCGDVVWAYTAMHGVGARIVRRVIEAAHLPKPTEVAAQIDPDPDFPTVPFPNPEEVGAMDMVIAAGKAIGADVAIATDPDADRCAAATLIDGVWRRFTGDELGALLGDDAMRRGVPGTFACSIVSSTLLGTMARARGRNFVRTLTGFKWIGRVPDLAFGYEEAIGYCCDSKAVADKDGISATATLMRLTAELKAQGKTLSDRLDDIDTEFGTHTTTQHSLRVEHLQQIQDMMARLRANPPAALAGMAVTVRDWRDDPADGLPATDAMEFSGESVHVVVRPSGTEPKLKCYLEARSTPAASAADLHAARAANNACLDGLWADVASALGA